MTSEELKDLRKSAGLTQESLAFVLNLSGGTIRSWESGRNPIKPLTGVGIKKAISDYIKTGAILR